LSNKADNYWVQKELEPGFGPHWVDPGIAEGVESVEIAANPATTISARMDERRSDFMGRSPIFLSKGFLVVCVLVNAG